MIKQYRGLAIAVLISSSLILIGAGHGVGPLVMFQLMLPFANEGGYKLSFSLSNSYENSIAASALMLFIGQLLLFIATHKEHIITRLIALFIMWIGLFFLTHDIFNGDSLAEFTFGSAIPFLILSIALFSFDVKQYWQRDKIDIEHE
ncbi:hypothetical protein [Mucilaginibacter endophyticus]|uniref:hypothetical protein n=1 Tax=Mucilaginibacter endophyticus TaxID=2675003 RepID=UPI000E0CD437|nr:hypothetical protein [Mucilaginibacter endophyticus]